MARNWLVLILAWIICGGIAGSPASAQVATDRPGNDYASVIIRSGDPIACAARCERDSRCRAWSFSYPRTERLAATCWLKNRVPRAVRDNCCVSGIRGARMIEPRIGPTEFSIDRAGGDYRSFDTHPDPQGAVCAAACKADKHCRAWTYSRPGYSGPSARCFLKDRVRPPRRKPCCISGVLR
jgi:hypothetical protein